jgi:hypothetical protein
MRRVNRPALALLLAFAAAAPAACRRPSSATPDAGVTPRTPAASDPSGTVGPLGDDCYATTGAVACPPDPRDPSGRKLAAHGGPCHLPVCRPCGSETKLAFRDEHGIATAGFCICVPMSDDSGRGVFSCFSTDAWKKRGR